MPVLYANSDVMTSLAVIDYLGIKTKINRYYKEKILPHEGMLHLFQKPAF